MGDFLKGLKQAGAAALLVPAMGVAWAAHTPALLPLRGLELAIVVGAASITLILLRAAGTARRTWWVAAVLSMAILSFGAYREGVYSWRRWRVLHAPGEAIAKLAPHVIAGFTRWETARTWASRGLVGGVFVTQSNVGKRTVAELRREITDLRAGRPDLLVTADQEGGPVSRLSPPLPSQPALAALARDGVFLDTDVKAYAEEQARALRDLGIDVDFSPVVDLKWQVERSALDLHTHIADRAIARDPKVVAQVATVYAQTLRAHGVMPTLKHFPGLGRVAGDTHLSALMVPASPDELAAADWVPFETVLKATPALLMVGHVRIPAMDERELASGSAALITGVVRQRWGFQGPVVTDDLCMHPTYFGDGGIGGAALRSLTAGADLLLVSYDGEQIFPLLSALLDAMEDGRLPDSVLDAGLKRIQTVRTYSQSTARP